MLTSMKGMLHVNGGCEIPGKVINIRRLQIQIILALNSHLLGQKKLILGHGCLFGSFHFFGIASIMIGLAQFVLQVWATSLFARHKIGK